MKVTIRVFDKKTLVVKERECTKLGKCGVYGQLRSMLRTTPIVDGRDYEITITCKEDN